MKLYRLLLSALAIVFSGFGSLQAAESHSLIGQWCVSDQGLILVFSTEDSMSVTSTTDSSVQGKGSYTKTDTTFSASIKNNDIVMKMDYRYRWKTRSNIEAQAILFTVNGDSVESPKEWTVMTRCTPKKSDSSANTKPSKAIK